MARRFVTRVLATSPRARHAISTADGWLLAARIEVLYRIRRRPPVLVFQMGKVGSTSVVESFPTRRHPLAIQTHHLYRPQIDAMRRLQQERGRPVRRHYYRAAVAEQRIMATGRPYKMVTLVREPIGRVISKFFQALDEFVDLPPDGSAPSIAALQEAFVARYHQLNEAYWFDREFEPAVGIDVYAHPFPHELGHQRLATTDGDILVLRLELDDAAKQAAVREFLDDPDFVLRSANAGESKHYADAYARFRRDVVLPMDHVDRLLGSRYALHFYSDDERAATREFWAARAVAAPGEKVNEASAFSTPDDPGVPPPSR